MSVCMQKPTSLLANMQSVGEFRDAGRAFYATDFWSRLALTHCPEQQMTDSIPTIIGLWDLGTVAIGLAFFISRKLQNLRLAASLPVGNNVPRL
jgi:hypothetical protein